MSQKLFMVLAASFLLGCSSTEISRAPVNVTIGQQLIDLKKAHDSGALSKKEYDAQREKLIDSVK